MSDEVVTFYWDGRIPMEFDRDDVELAKLFLADSGGYDSILGIKPVIRLLTEAGYTEASAKHLCILLRNAEKDSR